MAGRADFDLGDVQERDRKLSAKVSFTVHGSIHCIPLEDDPAWFDAARDRTLALIALLLRRRKFLEELLMECTEFSALSGRPGEPHGLASMTSAKSLIFPPLLSHRVATRP